MNLLSTPLHVDQTGAHLCMVLTITATFYIYFVHNTMCLTNVHNNSYRRTRINVVK